MPASAVQPPGPKKDLARHSRIVPSLPLDASKHPWPGPSSASPSTGPVCPVSTLTHSPVGRPGWVSAMLLKAVTPPGFKAALERLWALAGPQVP